MSDEQQDNANSPDEPAEELQEDELEQASGGSYDPAASSGGSGRDFQDRGEIFDSGG